MLLEKCSVPPVMNAKVATAFRADGASGTLEISS